jgi:Flp pilus assembly protein TadD
LLTVARALPAQAGDAAEVWFLRARWLSQLGLKNGAERLTRQGLERATNRPDMHVFLADLLIRQDRLEEAAHCLRQAVQLNPAEPGGYTRLGMVLDRLGDSAGAQEAFAAAVRLFPQEANARLLLGRWLIDHDQATAAAAQLERACQLDPQMAGAYYALSQARTQLGDAPAASRALRTFQELKEKEKAMLDAENAARDPDREMRIRAAGFHLEAAALFGGPGQESLAEAHLRQAIQIAPQEPRPLELLGGFCLNKGRFAEARALFQELARLRPEQAAYQVTLGALHLKLQDHAAAVREFKRALELEPKQAEALHNLARYYLSSGRELPEALALCQRLVSVDTKAASFDLLGWALYANGRTNEALAAAAQAVAKDPTNQVYRERHRRLVEAVKPSR